MAKKKSPEKASGGGGKKSKDLFFDIQAVHNVLLEKSQGKVNPEASVYLAGVLQCVAAEIIEAAARKKMESDETGSAITKEDMQKAVEEDKELNRLFHT